MVGSIEKNCNMLGSELIQEANMRVESMESMQLTMESELPKLEIRTKQEASERKESNKDLLNKINEEIAKLYAKPLEHHSGSGM